MNEHGFIRSIHNYLDPNVYRWKIHDTFTGGVPDVMYVGPRHLLFVEYKYLKSLPKKDTTTIKHSLSPQQKAWLERINQPAKAALVIGCNNSCVIILDDFSLELSRMSFIEQKRTKKEVAQWIEQSVSQ
ncbi:MAG TPA: hypothetical protein DCZ37_06520 [Alteromonas macleodii]|mgnify:FL=1|nr:hypothetical protein [Alteromonas macleodii]|tara:strand:+ start:1991 stop:2377 length:387 start_codon:yes stop_codon:yes gene_type:complete